MPTLPDAPPRDPLPATEARSVQDVPPSPSLFQQQLRLSALQVEAVADRCSACGLNTAWHFDSSGCLWIGCVGAQLRIPAQQPEPDHIVAAKEHAILAAAARLAELLYPADPGDPDDDPPSAMLLSPRELRCVIEMVEVALESYHGHLRRRGPRPIGCWQKALEDGRRRP